MFYGTPCADSIGLVLGALLLVGGSSYECCFGGANDLCERTDSIAYTTFHRAIEALENSPTDFSSIHPRLSSRTHRSTDRSEEHTSELQSLMRISYAVFCLQQKNTNKNLQPINLQ